MIFPMFKKCPYCGTRFKIREDDMERHAVVTKCKVTRSGDVRLRGRDQIYTRCPHCKTLVKLRRGQWFRFAIGI